MLEKIVDLHIHSKYARACSKDLTLPNIAKACEEKGIAIVSTGDFTHPVWFKAMQDELVEVGSTGFFKLKDESSVTRFTLGTEISCIYKHKDKTRRLHLLVFAPSFESVAKFIEALELRGVNLKADGRPIMGVSGKDIVRTCLNIDKRMVVVPAHAWTPWFAVFGSKSGYDTLEDCFEEETKHIFAIETGLSSDPPMNHRLSQLDKITLISNSDAHSLGNLGREANVFAFENEAAVTYDRMWEIVRAGDKEHFLYTIEFYPEEGMYHYDGHRDCKVVLTPAETKKQKEVCPVCKKKLTVGVLHRVDDLADRAENDIPNKFIGHRYIVPLRQIIANSLDVGVQSKKVMAEYASMHKKLGSEFGILLHLDIKKIAAAVSDERIAEGIENMRAGKLKIEPGYDGVYGVVDVFPKKKPKPSQRALL